ncbi:hypothetical protein [Georgenia sp. Z1491]|uniref:hypothetical protein n=1 Tax=Georgenia sp. Z1491 TaxID=3416707 RepID=UPI003CEC59FA
MDIVTGILLVIHLLGWAMALGMAIAGLRGGELPKGATHGVLTALVAGILLVGMAEMGDGEVNHIKIGVKLVIALGATVVAFLGDRDRRDGKKGSPMIPTLIGLIVVNVAVAVLWT